MKQNSLIAIFARNKAKSVVDLFNNFMKPSFKRHSINVAKYSVSMWKILVRAGNKSLATFTEQEIYTACALHDIGKSLIPDNILSKNGPLDEFERDVVKEHPRLGRKTLVSLALNHNKTKCFVSSELLECVAECHHERWDGNGYPNGIAGEAIPIVARLCAIADTYDAITSDRPYRRGASPKQAFDVLVCVSGSQLDEALVAPLLKDTSWITAARPEKK